MKRLTVVGGGFSGLACAHYAAKAGFQVNLYEAGPRFGGLLGSQYPDWGLVENAANALIRTPRVEELFSDLNIDWQKAKKASRRRYIFVKKPRRWPLGAGDTWQLLRFAANFRWRREKLRPQEGESLRDWGQRHLNPKILDHLLEPALQGIYAGSVDELNAALLLGSFFEKKKPSSYGGSVTPSLGMGHLMSQWPLQLSGSGANLFLNQSYELPQDLDHPHIVCLRADQAAQFFAKSHPKLQAQLSGVEMRSLVSATLSFNEASEELPGFGCLFPRDQGVRSLGVLFNSHIFEGRGRTETWILPGKDILELDDLSIVQLLMDDRRRLFGSSQAPVDYRLTRWPRALPVYNQKLFDFVNHLSLPKKLYLCGNYMGRIGLSKILDLAAETVAGLKEETL